jgi:hypothetical protein
VVFLGRKSFRMQVVGSPAMATNAGAVPSGTWDTPTERIIERRRSRPVSWPPPAPPAPAWRKSTMVGIALLTFACGVLVSTAIDRLRPHVAERAPQSAPTAPAQLAIPHPAPELVALEQAATAPIVQPLPKAEPEALPEIAPPVAAAIVATAHPAVAKPARARTTPPARLRRPAPVTEPGTWDTELDPFQPPAVNVKAPTPGKWVDPFAD